VAQCLSSWGYQVTRGLGGTGVVGQLRRGFWAGQANNVIPQTATLELSVRSLVLRVALFRERRT